MGIITGATRVTDFTAFGYLAANANASTQPMECATKWNEFNWNGYITDSSIISKWSLKVYRQSLGLGLLPNPNRSTANSL